MLDLAKGLGVGLIATAAAWFIAHNLGEMQGREEEKDRQEKIIADLRLDASERQNEMLTAYRSMEQLANAALKEKQDAYEAAQAQRAADLEAARRNHGADLAILRKRLAEALARPTSTAPGDPQPSTSEVAASIGGILADALRVQETLADGAEGNADTVRLLLADWVAMKAALTQKSHPQ